MADFSDLEDKRLVQIALKCEIKGVRICWHKVAHQFRRWKTNPEKLRPRLKHLKTRHGPKLCDFPRRYFAASTTVTTRGLAPPNAPPRATAANESADERRWLEIHALFGGDDCKAVSATHGSDQQIPAVDSSACYDMLDPANPLTDFNIQMHSLQPSNNLHLLSSRSMSDEECFKIVHTMFATVSRKEIHQKLSLKNI